MHYHSVPEVSKKKNYILSNDSISAYQALNPELTAHQVRIVDLKPGSTQTIV